MKPCVQHVLSWYTCALQHLHQLVSLCYCISTFGADSPCYAYHVSVSLVMPSCYIQTQMKQGNNVDRYSAVQQQSSRQNNAGSGVALTWH